MIRTTVHTARKSHRCDSCDSRTIRPGDRYIAGTVSPWHDTINECAHWATFAECGACATRYGRGHLVGAS